MKFQWLIESMISVDIIEWFWWLFNSLMLGVTKARAHLSKSAPVDTRCKLNIHKTFRRRPGRLLNVLCTRSIYVLCLPVCYLFLTKFILSFDLTKNFKRIPCSCKEPCKSNIDRLMPFFPLSYHTLMFTF